MYRSEREYRKAAKDPKERNMPFKEAHDFQVGPWARNDPVGREVYSADPYGFDKHVNYAERN